MDLGTFTRLTGVEIGAAVSRREVSAVAVTEAALERLDAVDPLLCAFTEVWGEGAVRRAAEVDRRIARGERLRLAGVPIAVKGRKGALTVAAERLLAEGCVPVGAASVPGAGTAWRTWGQGRHGRTVNPWRRDRTPGGSSAGSAVAVAAGVVPLATGNDGAGSVRIPGAWCGVFGLKLTNGLLPRRDPSGLAAPGVLTRSAADAAAYVRCVGGGAEPPPGLRPTAVWSHDLGFAEPEPDVALIARAALESLESEGALRLGGGGEGVALLDPREAWTSLRGTGSVSVEAEHIQAENNRRLDDVFARFDLVATPVTPNRPHGHDGPGSRYSTALTWAFNLSGHPGVSVPAGWTSDGCPVGLQLVARRGEESALLSVMATAERATPARLPSTTT